MPKVQANGITINYEQQGNGEPLLLIPYLAADFLASAEAGDATCSSILPRSCAT